MRVLFAALVLVGIWSAIFIWQAHALELDSLACSGVALARGEWWRIFSAPLTHVSTRHLLLNMAMMLLLSLFLDRFGPWPSFAIFMLGAFAGEAELAISAPAANGFGASAGLYALLGALIIADKKRSWWFASALIAALAMRQGAIGHAAGAAAGLLLGRFVPPRWLGQSLLALCLLAFAFAAYHLNAPDSVACGTTKSWPVGPMRSDSGG
jgi:membrane associated rhomboid family serine protease